MLQDKSPLYQKEMPNQQMQQNEEYKNDESSAY